MIQYVLPIRMKKSLPDYSQIRSKLDSVKRYTPNTHLQLTEVIPLPC
jgi:hypothetical protein